MTTQITNTILLTRKIVFIVSLFSLPLTFGNDYHFYIPTKPFSGALDLGSNPDQS